VVPPHAPDGDGDRLSARQPEQTLNSLGYAGACLRSGRLIASSPENDSTRLTRPAAAAVRYSPWRRRCAA
jgi:hypothetical protein